VPAALSLRLIRKRLHDRADASRVPILQRFFKTGPGQYAEGDVFVGVTVPHLRQVCLECRDAVLDDIEALLQSSVHEERLLALLLLVDRFERGTDAEQRAIYRFYLANTRYVNNWDLVDSSAPQIVGAHLFERSRAPLIRLARSRSLWERRIAIVATLYFIRQCDLEDTFRIADLLLQDDHDLIHKAVGWMLREAGKRDVHAARAYLQTRYSSMPRTMLRYAIERFPVGERKRYLRGAI
jgi:3-methyladenine DNA glycosylase AlkD